MNKKFIALILTILLFSSVTQAVFSETIVYHGADSVFSAEGVAVLWAILKDKESDSSTVYVKIAEMDTTDNSKQSFKLFSLLAADVFSGEEKYVVQRKALEPDNITWQITIKETGKSFDSMSKRRFLFYTGEKIGKNTAPDMEIYYLGVPDTTPVFLKEDQIDKYFKNTLLRLKKVKK